MDVIAADRDVGSCRGAAAICGTTHKTVKRINELHEAGGAVPERTPRTLNYDEVTDPVAKRVKTISDRISAKRGCCPRLGLLATSGLLGTSAGWCGDEHVRGLSQC